MKIYPKESREKKISGNIIIKILKDISERISKYIKKISKDILIKISEDISKIILEKITPKKKISRNIF